MPIEFNDQIAPSYIGNYKTDPADSLVSPDFLHTVSSTADGQMTSAMLAALNGLKELTDLQIATNNSWTATINAQATSDNPLVVFISSDIDVTVSGSRYQFTAPAIVYVPPRSRAANTTLNRTQLQAIVRAVQSTGGGGNVDLSDVILITSRAPASTDTAAFFWRSDTDTLFVKEEETISGSQYVEVEGDTGLGVGDIIGFSAVAPTHTNSSPLLVLDTNTLDLYLKNTNAYIRLARLNVDGAISTHASQPHAHHSHPEVVPQSEFDASTGGPVFAVYGSHGRPVITSKADLDGEYTGRFRAGGMGQILSVATNPSRASGDWYYEVYIADSGDVVESTSRVQTGTVTYNNGAFHVPISISGSEEIASVVQRALESTPGYVRFRITFAPNDSRNTVLGSAGYSMPIMSGAFVPYEDVTAFQVGPISEQDPGDRDTVARGDHVHGLRIDSSLRFNASDELGVNPAHGGGGAGLVFETPGNTVNASVDTVHRLVYKLDDHVYRTNVVHHNPITDVAWRDFGQSDVTALNSGWTWGGVTGGVGRAAVNTVFFVAGTASGHQYVVGFERTTTSGGPAVPSGTTPVTVPGYHGSADSESRAQQIAKTYGTGTVVFWNNKPQVATVTSTAVPDSYEFELYEHPVQAGDIRGRLTRDHLPEQGTGSFTETTVGPALVSVSSSTAWQSYTLTEALEADAFYAAYATIDGEPSRITLSTWIKGSELIGLTQQPNTTYGDNDDNVRTILVPRLSSTGAFQIHIGVQDLTQNQLYIHFQDASYDIVRFVKIIPSAISSSSQGSPGATYAEQSVFIYTNSGQTQAPTYNYDFDGRHFTNLVTNAVAILTEPDPATYSSNDLWVGKMRGDESGALTPLVAERVQSGFWIGFGRTEDNADGTDPLVANFILGTHHFFALRSDNGFLPRRPIAEVDRFVTVYDATWHFSTGGAYGLTSFSLQDAKAFHIDIEYFDSDGTTVIRRRTHVVYPYQFGALEATWSSAVKHPKDTIYVFDRRLQATVEMGAFSEGTTSEHELDTSIKLVSDTANSRRVTHWVSWGRNGTYTNNIRLRFRVEY